MNRKIRAIFASILFFVAGFAISALVFRYIEGEESKTVVKSMIHDNFVYIGEDETLKLKRKQKKSLHFSEFILGIGLVLSALGAFFMYMKIRHPLQDKKRKKLPVQVSKKKSTRPA